MAKQKMKTHRGAAKRFKKTGTGKFSRRSNYTSHILTKKTPKRKRQLRKAKIASAGDTRKLRVLMPY